MTHDFADISIVSQFLSSAKSQEDIDTAKHYQAECERLYQIGSSYQLDPKHPELYYGDQIAYTQVAANANIHRGVYCPSPIFDIIIGKTRRGKILQKQTKRSNITHQYYLGKNNKIFYSKRLHEGKHVSTEFLIYFDEKIIGITLDVDGNLVAMCEECYNAGNILSYRYAEYGQCNQQISCFRFRLEEYVYDEEGLSSSDVYTFNPMLQICDHEFYQFERNEGYLSSYTVSKQAENRKVENTWDTNVFNITIKRKA